LDGLLRDILPALNAGDLRVGGILGVDVRKHVENPGHAFTPSWCQVARGDPFIGATLVEVRDRVLPRQV
jgi:hypothetical protein